MNEQQQVAFECGVAEDDVVWCDVNGWTIDGMAWLDWHLSVLEDQ